MDCADTTNLNNYSIAFVWSKQFSLVNVCVVLYMFCYTNEVDVL